VTNDFLALLDTKNRQIVVLLNSGMTSKTEIAKVLGYANHSGVSKRLTQIRKTAETFFNKS
jgi:argonaute-like protein implicated in RNA metabolism and viral defense